MRKSITSVLFGMAFLVAAAVLLGNVVGIWDVWNFNGWWTMFLIIPGIAGLISSGFNLPSMCLTLIGTWLLARAQGWLPAYVADHLVWVLVLAFIGLYLIFGSGRRWNRRPADTVVFDGVRGANDDRNSINYSAVFASAEVSNHSGALCGGTVSGIFGSVNLDLRDAVPIDGAVVEANAVLGSVSILVPQNCRLRVGGTPFLGGCECIAQRPENPSLPLLTIRFTSVLGSVKIQ